jgi:hypothetical protein
MDQLDGARGRHRKRAITADGIGAGETEDRAQTFPAGGQAVAHRVGDHGRAVGRRWQDRTQCGLDVRATALEVFAECGRFSL